MMDCQVGNQMAGQISAEGACWVCMRDSLRMTQNSKQDHAQPWLSNHEAASAAVKVGLGSFYAEIMATRAVHDEERTRRPPQTPQQLRPRTQATQSAAHAQVGRRL
jgi:hypothetical protein